MRSIFTALLLIIIFQNCVVRSVYVPAPQNVPLFDSVKQLQANAFIGSNNFQAQLAYNPLKHLNSGVQVSYGSGLTSYEAQAGYYSVLRNGSSLRYEIVGGFGYTDNYASIKNPLFFRLQKKDLLVETVARYSKLYLQPALGFFGSIPLYKLKYSFSLSARLSYLNFYRFIYRETDPSSQNLKQSTFVVQREYSNKNMFLLEPCITNRVGKKNLYALIQVLAIVPYSKQIDIRNTRFSPVVLASVGIQYRLNLSKKSFGK